MHTPQDKHHIQTDVLLRIFSDNKLINNDYLIKIKSMNSIDKTKLETFILKNQKNILFYGMLFFGVVAYVTYQQFYISPEEDEAVEEMYYAKNYFSQDSLELALNGDGQNYGFLDIIKIYEGTKAANMSKYFVGLIYYKGNDYQKSIDNLKGFESDDISLSAVKLGLIGDAYCQMGNYIEAYNYYEKASQTKNLILCPVYLKKAGIVSIELKKYKAAVDYFSKIKKEFSDDPSAENINSYIALAESMQK